jgi:DNA-binding protein YbaB
LKFEGVRDYVDVEQEIAWVELSSNGRSERVDLKIDNDWVDPKIFAKLQDWLEETDQGAVSPCKASAKTFC